MNILAQVMAYYCLTYPHPQELSDARLTKMVYLSDWFSSLSLGNQITDISWYFNHYGPYVEDVLTTAQRYPDLFKVSLEQNYYGNTKKIIQYVGSSSLLTLNEQTKIILNAVVEQTKHMYFNDFIEFIYSTYPISKNDRYAYLDLPNLAKEYKTVAVNG